ncbi:MAG: SRPBCC family protein [Bacteroidota bacterium]
MKELAEQPILITIEAQVDAPVEKVWEFWTSPKHIMQWNNASDDWHTTKAENDVRIGGSFSSRMEAKDGSFGFDFGGVYDEVKPNEVLAYTLGDGRKVKILFSQQGQQTKIIETFGAEEQNTIALQEFGWQSILNNFKKYAEANK